jgi:hypothetical protein
MSEESHEIVEYTNEEYGLTNVTDDTKFVYVVLTEDWYGGDGDNKEGGFKVKVFSTFEKAKLYADTLSEQIDRDVIVMKKILD